MACTRGGRVDALSRVYGYSDRPTKMEKPIRKDPGTNRTREPPERLGMRTRIWLRGDRGVDLEEKEGCHDPDLEREFEMRDLRSLGLIQSYCM